MSKASSTSQYCLNDLNGHVDGIKITLVALHYMEGPQRIMPLGLQNISAYIKKNTTQQKTIRIFDYSNKDGKRDPEMHQTKKGNQYFFGMKAHIGVDAESGLVHTLVGTAANVADVTQVDQLLHGEETYVCGDAGYTGVDKRPEHQDRQMIWSIAARPSSYKKHAKKSLIGRMWRKIEYVKAQIRAKVEHPFRVIKRQFGYTKVRFRGLSKNIAQQTTLFALSNLWMVRKRLMGMGEVRL